jgi:hypothetical protein
LIIRTNDSIDLRAQELAERSHVEPIVMRLENREVVFRQSKQTHRRSQAPLMFRMRRLLEIFLEMNKRAGGLD